MAASLFTSLVNFESKNHAKNPLSCCFACAAKVVGIPKFQVEVILFSGITVRSLEERNVGITEVFALNETDRKRMLTICRNLLDLQGKKARIIHYNYYLRSIIPLIVDMRPMDDVELRVGLIYEVYHCHSSPVAANNNITQICLDAVIPKKSDLTYEDMKHVPVTCPVVITTVEDYPAYLGIDYWGAKVATVFSEEGVECVTTSGLHQLKVALVLHRSFGKETSVLFINRILPVMMDDATVEPARAKTWIEVLKSVYNDLDNMIVVFFMDTSTFQGKVDSIGEQFISFNAGLHGSDCRKIRNVIINNTF